ncbi:ABC transporter ATP-binding protein [Actinospica robiniae]|uniref:ABC transporter ATP-binding protein n=1 Tax=Actinospica robiniae TaxID=304901 RepID=UPI0004145CD9|nr:ABC transporter ATP-binding protein [Actinospica robiniae]
MTDPVIQATGLSKSFKATRALDGCDVQISTGRIVGLLGENGAGKTTLMRILAGLVRPTSGTVRVFGQPPGTSAVAGRIGVTIEGSAYYPWLSAHDNVAALHRGFGRALGPERIAAALGRVGLDQTGRRRAATLSQGQRQRLALAVAMAHEPDLLVLDEPANGLDPTGMADLRKLIVAERDRGATVLVSSHLLAELEEFCDTVVMMHRGKVVGTRDLDQAESSPRFLVEVQPGELAAAQEALEAAGVKADQAGEGSLLVEIDSGRAANQILVGAGIVPESVSPHHAGLEEYYFARLKEAGE